MDPLSQGGEDEEHNTVYCCVRCNLRKKDKLFVVWLAELDSKYRRLSRDIYTAKHGRRPEEFVPSPNAVVLSFDLEWLRKKWEQAE